MLYKASFVESLGETAIELASNSYSDSWPMLQRLFFRKMPVDLRAQSLPLAAAILTRGYCGDVFEFAGMKIAGDYAEAIRAVLPLPANVVNVDGMNRTISTGEVDIAVNRAGKSVSSLALDGSAPVARIDWSGDFVDQQTRSSAGFAFGSVQTNAAFFADPFSVSVAIGLLFGRDKCGCLHVAPAAPDLKTHNTIRDALRIIGITLDATYEREPQLQALAS